VAASVTDSAATAVEGDTDVAARIAAVEDAGGADALEAGVTVMWWNTPTIRDPCRRGSADETFVWSALSTWAGKWFR